MDKVYSQVFDTKKKVTLNEKELTDIIIAISKEFEGQSLEEILFIDNHRYAYLFRVTQ